MKKGFTLIELLAVIVVLSIIIVIAYATLSNVIEYTKKKALEESGYGLIKASETLVVKNLLKNVATDILISIDGKNITSEPENNNLEYDGDIPKIGKISITEVGSVSIVLFNDNICAVKSFAMKKIIFVEKNEIDCLQFMDIINEKPIAVADVTPANNIKVGATLHWTTENSIFSGNKVFSDLEWKNKENVYYEEGTYVVELRVKDNYDIWSDWVQKTIVVEEEPIVFSGNSLFFDGNNATGAAIGTSSQIITWTGNLSNKLVEFDVRGALYQTFRISVQNSSGVSLYFVNPINNTSTNLLTLGGDVRATLKMIVPEGAARISFSVATSSYGSGYLYEVSIPNMKLATKINTVNTVPKDDSVQLSWVNPTDVIGADIYRDGTYVATVIGDSYNSGPVYSDREYTHTIRSISSNNNRGYGTSVTDKTITREINWKGLNAGAFDTDSSTYAAFGTTSVFATWEGDLTNKVITVDLFASPYQTARFRFFDASNNPLYFDNITAGTNINIYSLGGGESGTRTQIQVKAPLGAVKVGFSVATSSYGEGRVYMFRDVE